jgi:hypothetical protein
MRIAPFVPYRRLCALVLKRPRALLVVVERWVHSSVRLRSIQVEGNVGQLVFDGVQDRLDLLFGLAVGASRRSHGEAAQELSESLSFGGGHGGGP